MVRPSRVVHLSRLDNHQKVAVLLHHDGLLGLVLGLLDGVDAKVVQVFLADHGARRHPEELYLDPLAFEGLDPDFTFDAGHDVGLAEVVPHVVHDRRPRGDRVLDQHVTCDALVAQHELDGTDHADAEALYPVDLVP